MPLDEQKYVNTWKPFRYWYPTQIRIYRQWSRPKVDKGDDCHLYENLFAKKVVISKIFFFYFDIIGVIFICFLTRATARIKYKSQWMLEGDVTKTYLDFPGREFNKLKQQFYHRFGAGLT